MSVTINNVVIEGRLGKDPETRYSPGGTAVTKLRLATNRKVKDEQVADWHTVVLFNGTAEFFDKNARKGDQVTVVGLLTYNKWKDKEGRDRIDAEILANTANLAPKGGANHGG